MFWRRRGKRKEEKEEDRRRKRKENNFSGKKLFGKKIFKCHHAFNPSSKKKDIFPIISNFEKREKFQEKVVYITVIVKI